MDVELTVETKPNSYVGILGVDQSVLLLKSGNDITEVNDKTVVCFMPYHLRNVLVPSHYFNSCQTEISLLVLLNITGTQNNLYTNFCWV